MGKILVVRDADLNKNLFDFFNDNLVLNSRGSDVLDTITKKAFWHERDLAEKDFSLRQIIVYTVLVDFKQWKVFSYRRDPGENYDEARLRNKWSIGLGGHISQEKDGVVYPIECSIRRELKEEADINFSLKRFYPIAFLYGAENEVDRVHLGILNLVDDNWDGVKPASKEIAEGRTMTMEEMDKLLSDPQNEFETWSKAVIDYVKREIDLRMGF